MADGVYGDRGLDETRIDRLRHIITGTDALARTEKRIADLHAQALAALDDVDLDGGADAVLRALAEASTGRRR